MTNPYASPNTPIDDSPERPEGAPPSSFMLLRIPLILGGLAFLAVPYLFANLPDSPFTNGSVELQSVVALAVILGGGSIILGCICHKPDKRVFWASFGTALFYAPSLFFIFGVPMLVFLLRKPVQDYYGVKFKKEP